MQDERIPRQARSGLGGRISPSSNACPGYSTTTAQQPIPARDPPRRAEAPGINPDEGVDVADEAASRGSTTTRFNRKESLAVKTGDVRGALERGLALTRSCTGQQNLRLNVLPVPTQVTMDFGMEIR